MLEINVKASKKEVFDERKNEFLNFELEHDYKLMLEHSLVSISKWESKWHKPFLNKDKKTDEELLDYIKCMIVTANVPDDIVKYLSKDNMKKINAYIENSMTATTFTVKNKQIQQTSNGIHVGNKKEEIITSEIIYYWMIEYGIPVEFQKWHLNRLLTLIRVCNIKTNQMNKKDAKYNKGLGHYPRRPHGVR